MLTLHRRSKKIALAFFLCAPLVTKAASGQKKQKEAPAPAGNVAFLHFIQKWDVVPFKKDEFETADAYKERIVNSGFYGNRFTVFVKMRDRERITAPKSFSYDAERQELTVWLGGHGTIKGIQVADHTTNPFVQPPHAYPKYVLESKENTRSYRGTNGFGATAKITNIHWNDLSFAIANMPLDASNFQRIKRVVYLPPAEAKALLENPYWQMTVEPITTPLQRKFIADDISIAEATIQNPTRLTQESKVVMVNVIKAELIDTGTLKTILTIDGAEPEHIASKQETREAGNVRVPKEGCEMSYSLIANTKLCQK